MRNGCAKNGIMNWDDLKIFLAIARSGQMLAAGRALNLNHATVARRLNALEAELGVGLFVRRTTGCDLTAEGEALLVRAERIESEYLGLRAEVGQSDTTLSGTVRIGAPDGFGVSFLAPRLGELTQTYPDLRIQLVPVPRSFSLSKREADIAITLERPTHGRLVARKLVDYQLALFAAQSYLDRHGIPIRASELKQHRKVGYVDDLIFTPSLNFNDEPFAGWQPDFAISSAIGQTEAVRNGAGIGILHTYIADQYPELIRVLPGSKIDRNYWLTMHEDLRAIRRVSVTADFIADLVKQHASLFRTY